MSVTRITKDGIEIEVMHMHNGVFHNDNGPAWIQNYDDGTKKMIAFYKNGKLHSEQSDPSKQEFYSSGKLKLESYYENGRNNDRFGIPSVSEFYESGGLKGTNHYKDGKMHCDTGPACILYYENGKIKRTEYSVDGQYHNVHGPAIKDYDVNGYQTNSYWLNDTYYDSITDWKKALKPKGVAPITPKAITYGCICRKCKVFYEYAEPEDDGKIECWGCKNPIW